MVGLRIYFVFFIVVSKVRDGENCNDIDGAVGLYVCLCVCVSRERERDSERLSYPTVRLFHYCGSDKGCLIRG